MQVGARKLADCAPAGGAVEHQPAARGGNGARLPRTHSGYVGLHTQRGSGVAAAGQLACDGGCVRACLSTRSVQTPGPVRSSVSRLLSTLNLDVACRAMKSQISRSTGCPGAAANTHCSICAPAHAESDQQLPGSCTSAFASLRQGRRSCMLCCRPSKPSPCASLPGRESVGRKKGAVGRWTCV